MKRMMGRQAVDEGNVGREVVFTLDGVRHRRRLVHWLNDPRTEISTASPVGAALRDAHVGQALEVEVLGATFPVVLEELGQVQEVEHE